MKRRSHSTSPKRAAAPATMHERLLYAVLLVLAFLMPFKFGLLNLDVPPNAAHSAPSILALLEPLQPWATEIAELLVVLAAFFWLLNMIVTRRIVFRYTTADIFLWAFLGVGLISSCFTILPHSAIGYMKEFGCWALLYHLIVNMPGGQRRERALLFAMLAGMMCVSLIGLHQWLIGYEQTIQQVYRFVPPEQQEGYLALLERARVMGTFTSPNSLGGLYALLLPLACAFTLVVRQWTQQYGAAPTVIYAILAPLLAFGVFMLTESKGAFISVGIVAVVAAIALYARTRVPWWGLAGVFVFAFAVAAVVLVWTPQGRTLVEKGAYTFEERIGYWRGAQRMAADRPPLRNAVGSGFNAFGVLFPKYKDAPTVVQVARNAHNNYVQLFIEVGVLGLAAFVAFWIVQLARAGPVVQAFVRDDGPVTFGTLVVIAAFFGLLGFLLHSVVDFDLYVPGIAMSAMALVGLMARHTGHVRERAFVLRKELHAVAALAALMVITAPLVLFIPMPLTGEVHYYNAYAVLADQAIERPADPEQAAIDEMRQALQWDWLNHNYMAYLGAIYARRGVREGRVDDLDQAEQWYERALELNPSDFWLRYRIATVRLDRMRLQGRVDWGAVLADIGRAVEFFPKDPYMRVLYAYHLDEAGRQDEARTQFALAEAYDDEAYTHALRSAKRRYNDASKLDQFKVDLERLRAEYGTRPAPEHDGAGADGELDNEHTGG